MGGKAQRELQLWRACSLGKGGAWGLTASPSPHCPAWWLNQYKGNKGLGAQSEVDSCTKR